MGWLATWPVNRSARILWWRRTWCAFCPRRSRKRGIGNLKRFAFTRRWWTSIANDPEAPFRLAAASKLNLDCDSRGGTGSGDKSRDSHLQGQHLADPCEHSSEIGRASWRATAPIYKV